ncbi:hypothetical protein BH09BAC6_BH09BAC6_22780 [soil metagenome]|jgi:ketosteroid isomerase-like protein
MKRIFIVLVFSATGLVASNSYANNINKPAGTPLRAAAPAIDTIPAPEVVEVINTVISATNNFDIGAVANLYTPNAVVADDEPPYSWNGPTAGVQWINAVDRVCRENSLTHLKGKIEHINVYQQTDDNVYVVVPVSFSGMLPHKKEFTAIGAFTFVLRKVNGKWLIKSQAWMPQKGM